MECTRLYHMPVTCLLSCRFISGIIFVLGSIACSSATPLLGATGNPTSASTVDADYPGGNIVVEQMAGDVVRLHPDLRDTKGWWFYWNFRVRGAQGRTLMFQFTGRSPIGVRGPAVSVDHGKNWSWLGAEVVDGSSFVYTFGADVEEARFCLAMPYQQADLEDFLVQYRDRSDLRVEELCRTAKGRNVERLHAGRLDGKPRFRILLTARHHACEMMASYVLEGVLDAILADTPEGQWFRHNVEVLAIPFVDKDGVEEGDQGKNRIPRDHNRDYVGTSLYPSVAALRTFVPKWSAGKLRAAFDLHCPYIQGQYNEVIYIVGSADESIWQEQCRFGRILEDIQQGPLVYRASDNLPFGTAWNTGQNYATGMSCSRWATGLEGVRLVASFEIPYANASGRVVTADAARAFGHSLAGAIRSYLEQRGEQSGASRRLPYVQWSRGCYADAIRTGSLDLPAD